MNIFSGSYIVTLDDKGRFSFPSKQINQMDDRGVFVNLGCEGSCIWITPRQYWQQLVQRITSNSSPLDESINKALMRYFVSFSFEQEIEEKTRRLSINQQLLDKIGVKDKAIMVGMVQYFELWEPSSYEYYMEKQEPLKVEAIKELGGAIKF